MVVLQGEVEAVAEESELPVPPQQLELILAKERAEAAAQAKSSFLAGNLFLLA